MVDTSNRLLREKKEAEKEFKKELKDWKKKLGGERRLKLDFKKT